MSDQARLQELEDREAIRQLFVDYASYLDGADYEAYAKLFSREGKFGDAVGPEAIAEHMRQYGERVDAARSRGIFNDAIHLITNQDIQLSGDTATTEVIWSYLSIDADKVPSVYQMGRYNDDLVREDGVWKIAHHRISRIMGRAQMEPPEPTRLDAVKREMDDREAIRQIFADYAKYLDRGDHAGYASLFAKEGVLAAQLGDAIGPKAIEELLDKARAPELRDGQAPAIHVLNNHDIQLDGDTAKAEVVWYYLTSDQDGMPSILQGGRYFDDLVREDGAWKIARHDITRMFGHSPLEEPKRTRLDEIEQRLKDMEDREAITRHCIETSNCLDTRDLVGYGNAFTEDGEWAGIVGRAVGPAAITELLSQYCKPWESEGHRTHHTTLDVLIDLNGDTARATCKWQHIMRGENDEPVVMHHGHYDDRLRRTPEGWRFIRRAAYGDIPYTEPKFQLIGVAKADAETGPLTRKL